jgi:hypothetical protein
LSLPKPGDEKIIAPQVAVWLSGNCQIYFWRVFGLDQSGDIIEQSQQVFSFLFRILEDEKGYTVISGLVKSDLNQAALVGARVAVTSGRHNETSNWVAVTLLNGEYIVIAFTRGRNGEYICSFGDPNCCNLEDDPACDLEDPIPSPIRISFTKEGFKPTTVSLPLPDFRAEITPEDLVLESTADSDGDGIRDAVEKPSCLNENDADTDDDGISDGNEDADHDGAVDASETNPCDADTDDDGISDGNEDTDHDGAVDDNETNPREADTDKDGLLDGTEIGLTAPQGSDTDLNVFVPDADPTTKTDPRKKDSDNDGVSDGKEDANHNGRVDSGETDPIFFNLRALPHIPLLLLSD